MGLNWRGQDRMPVPSIYSISRVICDGIDVVERISLSVVVDCSGSRGMVGRWRQFA